MTLSKLIPILLLFSLSIPGNAQENLDEFLETQLVPYRIGNSWGFANRNREIIIPVRFSKVEIFNEYGLAKVALGGPNESDRVYGYIDRSGKEIIKIGKYRGIGEFEDSVAAFSIRKGDTSFGGMIDLSGNEIIPPEYQGLKILGEGLIRFQIKHFPRKYINVKDKFGIIDKENNIVLPAEYYCISRFINGMAIVKKKFSELRSGMINNKGEVIIPLIYRAIVNDYHCGGSRLREEHFNEGLIAVQLDDKWGFVDFEGKLIVPIEYDYVFHFENGFATVGMKNEEDILIYGLIDKKGDLIVPLEYDWIGRPYSGLALTKKIDKYGYFNMKGELAIPFKYDYALKFEHGMAKVGINKTAETTDKNMSFIDSTGEEIFAFEYDYVHPFHDGLARVEKDEKYGFIDKKGIEVIPLIYEATFEFLMGGYAVVMNDNMKWGIVDKANKQVFPFEYETILPVHYSQGLFIIFNDDHPWDAKVGFIDIDGNKFFEK
ncbi:MAG: WG repeat-containing protein [Bacteroidetes bacterium]|nr:WG repeat-containing protein [Bacteroidota bacterium]